MRFTEWNGWVQLAAMLSLPGLLLITLAKWWTEFYCLVQDWQTLIAGLIALIAATATIRTMEKARLQNAEIVANNLDAEQAERSKEAASLLQGQLYNLAKTMGQQSIDVKHYAMRARYGKHDGPDAWEVAARAGKPVEKLADLLSSGETLRLAKDAGIGLYQLHSLVEQLHFGLKQSSTINELENVVSNQQNPSRITTFVNNLTPEQIAAYAVDYEATTRLVNNISNALLNKASG